jgi:hypothetical protein
VRSGDKFKNFTGLRVDPTGRAAVLGLGFDRDLPTIVNNLSVNDVDRKVDPLFD